MKHINVSFSNLFTRTKNIIQIMFHINFVTVITDPQMRNNLLGADNLTNLHVLGSEIDNTKFNAYIEL